MSETSILAATLTRMLDAHERGEVGTVDGLDASLWGQLDDAGFMRVGVSEAAGGSGGTVEDAATVLSLLASAAARVPIVETIAAGWLCEAARLVLPAGVITVGPTRPGDGVTVVERHDHVVLDGCLDRIPWARAADHVVVVARCAAGTVVVPVERERLVVTAGYNVAGEPRDRVELNRVWVDAADIGVTDGEPRIDLLSVGAALRSVATAAAMCRTVELARVHLNERVQFGRTLATNPLLRDYLARMVGEAAASTSAARSALAFTDDLPSPLAVAAAKVRTGRGAADVADLAHQLVGAIGFTDEHQLHRFTTRLWAWQDEFGTAGWWQERLGVLTAAAGAEALWDCIIGERQEAPRPLTDGGTDSKLFM